MAVLLTLLQACSESTAPEPPVDPNEPNLQEVESYLTTVSDWPTPDDPFDPVADDAPQMSQEVVDSVKVIAEDGGVSWDTDVEYVCTTTPYSFANTPEQIVSLAPDGDILWAGALLQGKSHADPNSGPGSLAALPIGQRAPIQISIPDISTGTNFRTVEVVTQANVDAARGDIIGNAVAEGLFTPASDDFEVETYNSEAEFALKTKISGRYLRFSGSASGSIDRGTSETTIAVRYIQRLYDVVVGLPQTPRSFFTDEFTQARLDEQVGLGRIGPDNQPVYVSNVVYGRMMMFTMTAQASATEMTAIVNASYNGLVADVSAGLNVRQKEILSSSRIAISTYGGGRNGTQEMIRSGDWREYFNRDIELSEAEPLSFTFRTLTGEIAAVTETTKYEVQNCQPLGDTPLLYPNDGAAQDIGSPVPTPFDSYLGDVNGDGIEDLILNHLSPLTNSVAVLPGSASGTFGSAVVTQAPTVPLGGWGNYSLVIGNVTGDDDDRDDLVWTNFGDQAIDTAWVYVSLGEASGSVTFGDRQQHPDIGLAAGWRAMLADLDGNGDDDIYFNYLASGNRSYWGLSNGDGTFTFRPTIHDAAGGWGPYEAWVGDVDNDGRDEVMWNSRNDTEPNRSYVGQLVGGTPGVIDDWTMQISAAYDHPTACCWTGYERVVGDFDGDQRTDFLFLHTGRIAHRGYSNGFGSWTNPAYQTFTEIPSRAAWTPVTGDFDGDGVDDVLINDIVDAAGGSQNEVWVLPGRANRTFASPQFQPNHPASDTWTSVRDVLVGDVTGEGRADVVWVVPGATSRVYVGLGRS